MARWVNHFIKVLVLVLVFASLSEAVLAAKQEEIVFWSNRTGPQERLATESAIKAFEQKYPDIKVKIEYVPWDQLSSKLPTALISGTAPDCSTMGVSLFGSYAAMDAFEPLDNRLKTWSETSYFSKGAWAATTFEGQRQGILIDSGPSVLFYNKKKFKQVGLDPNRPPPHLGRVYCVCEKTDARFQ